MRPQHWLYTIPLRLRSLFRRRHVEQELNEELQFHLEHKIELRLLLTESLILASLGGLVGIAVGYGIVLWFQSFQNVIFMTDLPFSIPFRMDTRVLLASLALSALSALLCGLAPALQSTRVDLVNGLKSADVDVPGRKRLWGRNVLVVAQVSASLMLLTASFLMVRG